MTSPTPSTLEAMCQSYMGITMAESQEEINGLRAGLVLCIAISVVLVLTIGIACSIHGDTFTCNETGGTTTNSNEVQDKEQKPSRRGRATQEALLPTKICDFQKSHIPLFQWK